MKPNFIHLSGDLFIDKPFSAKHGPYIQEPNSRLCLGAQGSLPQSDGFLLAFTSAGHSSL